MKPVHVGVRDDFDLLRKKILDMSYTKWKKMGFSKGSLHYMKQNVKSDKPFTLNTHVRLETWGEFCARKYRNQVKEVKFYVIDVW
ncbi:CRISP-associated protein Cas1 [Methanococcoides vulcani]|uniref:CRISP-associated protein Cas1 n=1 Tax=Methanococcoides vulcani TaxID=1353158 RepID=A0A1H9ZU80_9EURY|nr:hypothetical protein [Methanococcoides vulcani]SES85307.1 CRISP-associated protein Cas1 [Methanococcoides vulcani]